MPKKVCGSKENRRYTEVEKVNMILLGAPEVFVTNDEYVECECGGKIWCKSSCCIYLLYNNNIIIYEYLYIDEVMK